MVTVSTIANASQGELLCITYELFLYNIEEALKEVGEARREYVNRALEVIATLTEGLNFEVPLSQDLFKLYIYVQGTLCSYHITDLILENAYKIMDTLYQGFLNITDKVKDSAPSMKNAETIFAGITYGKDSINEIVISDTNRGFKA